MKTPTRRRGTDGRRRTGLTVRLVATLMVPIVALTALGAFDARQSRREADAATQVERQVRRVERDLELYLHLVAEETASESVVQGHVFGLTPGQVGELLGTDVLRNLRDARAELDEAPPRPGTAAARRLPQLRSLRSAIDAGAADGPSLARVFPPMIDDAEHAWFATIGRLGSMAFETEGSASVRRAATGLERAAAAFTQGSRQTSAAAKLAIPGFSDTKTASEELIVATSLHDDAVADMVRHLTPRARLTWRRVRIDRSVLVFERFVDRALARPDDIPAMDLPHLASLFGTGISRQARLREVVEVQADDIVGLARDVRADAVRDLHRSVAWLSALVVLSLALVAATARSIVRPLRRLARRARDVSAGQIDGEPLPVHGPSEVALVTDAFNESVATLRAVASEAAALAAADFDHPSLRAPVPGLIGEALRESVDRLSRSMRDNEELRRSLARKATHDPLTDLPNRVLLLDRLEQALARADRAERSVGVVFIDLDHFKVVNDAKGHTAGDRLLVEVAARIRSSVRSGDTVARFGGDEFVVVLEGIEGALDAAIVCDGIRERLEQPFTIDGAEIVVSASQGIAVAAPGDTAEDLLRTADSAMYAAKERGRARTEVADDATRSRATRRLQVEAGLRRALEADEFVVHFQPVVSLADGSLVGTEALVRWKDPERGLVPPDQFIPIAEETGLIVPLGERVLLRALEEAATWPVLGGDAAPYVAVNVSGRQFVVPGFASVVARTVAQARIDPARVCLELTESVLMRDVEHTTRRLGAIADLGVRISVDDFGTGYSSLRYVQRLPIDTLKIDKSFVDLLEHGQRESSIVTAVVDLARALGMDAVAEGVETPRQLEELRRLGCPYAQGYYFARPMTAAALRELFSASPDGRVDDAEAVRLGEG